MGNVKGDKSVRLYKAKQIDQPYRTMWRGGRMTPELKKAIIKAIEAEARRKWGEGEEE